LFSKSLPSMLTASVASQNAALQVMQQAATALIRWAGAVLSFDLASTATIEAIKTAKDIIGWSDQTLQTLQLVFDSIYLNHNSTKTSNYRPAWALDSAGETCPRIPYAQSAPPDQQDLDKLRAAIREASAKLDWNNLAQLTLFVEKFGSHLSLVAPDVALIDLARSTAAIAAALAQQPKDEKLALIGGDLMGVQKFIYTISSEGALKSLRARSFYLELAAEEVVQQILTALELPRTNVIYAGASKFYLLVAATDQLAQTVEHIQSQFNDWLRETFQRKVFLAVAIESFPAKQLKTVPNADCATTPLAQIWQQVNNQLTAQASRKFANQLDAILEERASYQPCKVCHRDDVLEENLRRLNELEDDSPMVCETCESMFQLGDYLLEVKAWVRSPRQSSHCTEAEIQVYRHYYRSVSPNYSPKNDELVFQINNWNLTAYGSNQFVPMLLGNYFQRSSEGGFLSAGEMAEAAQGIKRVGYLRMDVDRLSQIFSQGLGRSYTLPRLACLSRQMTYFFKVYLNSLAASRTANFINHQHSNGISRFKFLTPPNMRKNLLFIYAGGDDLFVSGAWNETVEFAFDVYQAFRAYTGHQPDITLSAGVSLAEAKFPLYQAADEAGEVEKAAKRNGRDSFGLFNATLKWDEWLGEWNEELLKPEDRNYLASVAKPSLFGVLPFVERLSGEIGQGYKRSFVRNLLNTAQAQEEKIKEAKAKHPDQLKDIRYYLHLPKIVYTLARLPDKVLDDSDFRKSLKNPYNAPYFRVIATWIELLNR
jgi:CRISPR-associated protein Csm1